MLVALLPSVGLRESAFVGGALYVYITDIKLLQPGLVDVVFMIGFQKAEGSCKSQ